MRFFNTAGPMMPDEHYCIPPPEPDLDRCGAAEGHLVIFDRTPDRPWEQKLFRREPAADGPPITVWGM